VDVPDAPDVAVFAPSVFLSITIEDGGREEADDIHLHAGGQGIWVARMLRHLGRRAVVCAPVGGESGRALAGLTHEWGIDLRPVRTDAATPAYVHDRRSGERRELARSQAPELTRHELDELYHAALELGLAAGVAVVTGRYAEETVPSDFYRRLGADLHEAGVPVVGDLHGDELEAFLDGGAIRILKVSDGDLVEDGRLDHGDVPEGEVAPVVGDLVASGVEGVVVSRADHPTLARFGDRGFRVSGPELEVVDTLGSGDSMTAALAAGIVTGAGTEDMLRHAWAAGAANVTRHGLGSASPGLITELADQVTIERWEVR
jgi:1-phosphofructokinase